MRTVGELAGARGAARVPRRRFRDRVDGGGDAPPRGAGPRPGRTAAARGIRPPARLDRRRARGGARRPHRARLPRRRDALHRGRAGRPAMAPRARQRQRAHGGAGARRVRIASVATGTVVGEMALLSGGVRSGTVVADEDVLCFELRERRCAPSSTIIRASPASSCATSPASWRGACAPPRNISATRSAST